MIGILTIILMLICLILAVIILKTGYLLSGAKKGKYFIELSLKIFIGVTVFLILFTSYFSIQYYSEKSCDVEYNSLGVGASTDDYVINSNYYGYIVNFDLSPIECKNTLYYDLCFEYNNSGGDNVLRFLNGNNLESNFIYINNGTGEECISFTRNERNVDDYCSNSVGLYCEDCDLTNTFTFSRFIGGSNDVKRIVYNGSFRDYDVFIDYPLAWSLKSYNNCTGTLFYMLLLYFGLLAIISLLIAFFKGGDKLETYLNTGDNSY